MSPARSQVKAALTSFCFNCWNEQPRGENRSRQESEIKMNKIYFISPKMDKYTQKYLFIYLH